MHFFLLKIHIHNIKPLKFCHTASGAVQHFNHCLISDRLTCISQPFQLHSGQRLSLRSLILNCLNIPAWVAPYVALVGRPFKKLLNDNSAVIERRIADLSYLLRLIQIDPDVVRCNLLQIFVHLKKEVSENHIVQLQRSDAQTLYFASRKVDLIALRQIPLIRHKLCISRRYFVVSNENNEFLIHHFQCVIRNFTNKLRHERLRKLFAHIKIPPFRGTQKEVVVL